MVLVKECSQHRFTSVPEKTGNEAEAGAVGGGGPWWRRAHTRESTPCQVQADA
jgi:hypothetical protein